MSKTLHDATLPLTLEGLLFGDDIMKRTSVVDRWRAKSKRPQAAKLVGLAIFSLLLLCSLASYASVPAVIGSTQSSLSSAWGDSTTCVSKVVTDSQGNIFLAVPKCDTNGGAIYKLPADGGAPQTVASGIGALWGLALGADGSVYYTDRWNNHVRKIPYLGGGAYGNAVNMFSNIPNLSNWWFGGSDLVVDAHDNIYISYEWGGGVDKVTCVAPGSCSGEHVLSGAPSGEITNLTLDSANNLYVTTSDGKVFRVAAGSTSAVQIGTGVNASGTSVDRVGNLFIADKGNQRIVEIPNVGGSLDTANQFTVAGGVTLVANAAPDASGNLIVATDSSLTRLSFSGSDLGVSPVGTASGAASIGYVFNGDATPTISFVVKGAASSEFASIGGTCANNAAYAAGDACVLEVAFTPAAVGARPGAVIFSDGAGNTLSAFSVSGIGVGPGLVFDPGTQTEMKPGTFTNPQAVAIDGAGNIYVADTSKTTVKAIAVGTGVVTDVGSGLSSPSGVAVDGVGNLYISDAGNGRVVVVPNIGGALQTSAQTAILTNINKPAGLAVDRLGNVYVAETGNKMVMKLSKSVLAGGLYLQNVVARDLTAPSAVAVDDAGNIFVADTGSAKVVEVSPSGSQSTVVAGLGWPAGLATDAAGSLYIADGTNKTVTKIPFEDGAFNPNAGTWIGTGFVNPQGVALDARGNAYIADLDKPGVFAVSRTQGLLDFGSFNTSYQSDTQVALLYSIGNQPANVAALSSTGDSGDFTVDASACIGAPVAPGTTCTVATYFVPSALGTRTAVSTVASDAANASPIQLTETGIGTNLTATTINIAMTTPASGTPSFGQAVTLTATVASASGTPAGMVIFAIDGVQQPAVALASGTASFTTSTLLGGSHSVTAKYTGGTTYSSSITQSPLAFTVDLATASVSVSAKSTTYGLLNTYNVSDTATLTANVSATITTMPTGSVTFYAGTQALGTASLSSGVAKLTLALNALPVATYQLTAKYSGDVNFRVVTSPAVSLVVTPEPTFTLKSDVASASVKPGQTGVFHITFSPLYNFADTTTLTCSGLLPQTACMFTVSGKGGSSQTINTATVTPLSGEFPSITLQLTTVGPGNGVALASASRQSGVFFAMVMPGIAGIFGVFSLTTKRDKRIYKIAGLILVLVVLAVMTTACGVGQSTLPAKASASTGTPAGTTTVTVTATSNSSGSVSRQVVQTMQLKLTVVN